MGNITKIHLAVDSCGNPIDFIQTGGKVVENVFAFVKQYRALTTRYDKLARNYAASLAMICCIC